MPPEAGRPQHQLHQRGQQRASASAEHRQHVADAVVEELAKARRDDAARGAAGIDLREPVDRERRAQRQDEGRDAVEDDEQRR